MPVNSTVIPGLASSNAARISSMGSRHSGWLPHMVIVTASWALAPTVKPVRPSVASAAAPPTRCRRRRRSRDDRPKLVARVMRSPLRVSRHDLDAVRGPARLPAHGAASCSKGPMECQASGTHSEVAEKCDLPGLQHLYRSLAAEAGERVAEGSRIE